MAQNIIRDFTDSKRAELVTQIKESQGEGLVPIGGSWIKDTYHNIANIKIDNYLDNIASYHKLVLDTKDTTVTELNKIFDAANNVDSIYSSRLDIIYSELQNYKKTVSALANLIKPNASIDVPPFTQNTLLDELREIGNGAIDYYMEQFMEIDSDGKSIYNWDKIRETLIKEADEVTVNECTALRFVVTCMNTYYLASACAK